MGGPLADYRVLEVTSTVSGPMAAMVLADQGADVIKIEPPLLGDTIRYLGSTRNGVAGMFAVLNRNKRSLVLDLKAEAEMEIFRQLVATADVLLENYRPGVVRKLGIDHESLWQINPRLVYASISGYGQSGPYMNRKVYDPLIQATTGMAHAQGLDVGAPTNVATIIFDKVTALTTAQAITAALLQRAKTGKGQYLSISMLESALYYNWPDVMWSRTLQGEDIRHVGELADYFQIFKAKDGHVAILPLRDQDFEVLCVWRNATLHQEPRFRTFPDRLAHRFELKKAVEAMIADLTTQEVCETLDSFNIPVARVNSLDEVHEDPQVRHSGSLAEVEHPVAGAMRYARPPFRFEGDEAFPRRHAPAMGDHTREILHELGVEEEQIERMEQREAANREMLRSFGA